MFSIVSCWLTSAIVPTKRSGLAHTIDWPARLAAKLAVSMLTTKRRAPFWFWLLTLNATLPDLTSKSLCNCNVDGNIRIT